MKKQYEDVLNENNIKDFNVFKAKRILRSELRNDREAFIHFLFTRWVSNLKENIKMEDMALIYRTIWKNNIKLADPDRHELALIEERAFSKIRHIKVLEVDLNLKPKEAVGAKFVNAKLYKKNKKLKFLLEANLLISNNRIFMENKEKNLILLFEWVKITYYKFTNYGFEFGFNNDTYVIRIHDQEALNNTIENFISRKVKNAIKKRKDN